MTDLNIALIIISVVIVLLVWFNWPKSQKSVEHENTILGILETFIPYVTNEKAFKDYPVFLKMNLHVFVRALRLLELYSFPKEFYTEILHLQSHGVSGVCEKCGVYLIDTKQPSRNPYMAPWLLIFYVEDKEYGIEEHYTECSGCKGVNTLIPILSPRGRKLFLKYRN